MKHIANINGKDVYSDKGVRSIVNTRVTFTDGSWCDVNSGDIVNNGPGSINIGGPGASANQAKITKGPTAYNATSLEVRGVVADVDIRIGPGYGVEISGPEAEVNAIRICVSNDRLLVEGDGGRSGGSTFIQTGRGHVVTGNMAGNNVIITGQVGSVGGGSRDRQSATQIRIMVPVHAPISVDAVCGKTQIADTDGTLNARAMAGDVYAGRIRDASLTVQGGSDIKIAELNGSLAATVQGSGDVFIAAGRITSVVASVQGSGDVKIRGKAENASLSVMGSGDIYLAHSTQRPIKNVMGSGDIEVANW